MCSKSKLLLCHSWFEIDKNRWDQDRPWISLWVSKIKGKWERKKTVKKRRDKGRKLVLIWVSSLLLYFLLCICAVNWGKHSGSISIKKSVEYEVLFWRQVSTNLMKPLAFTSVSDNLLLKDLGSMKQNKLPRTRQWDMYAFTAW